MATATAGRDLEAGCLMASARRRPVLGSLARTVSSLFFVRIEVAGEEHLPDGPAIYVANHGNGLVDPMLLIGWLPPGIRFLAKSTLWRHPVIGPWVRMARAIPVYRPQDAGADMSRNRETFARAYEVLGAGGGIGIFPEGGSFFAPGLLQLRSGAARIALGAEAAYGPLGVVVVPVGFNYEARDRFRSRVLIRIGPPLRVVDEVDSSAADSRAEARRLTEKIDAALRGVTLNFISWEEERLLQRAADVYVERPREVPTATRLESLFATRRAFAEGYPELRRRWPEKTAAAAACVRRYERLLRVLGVDDRQVVASYPPRAVLRYVVRTVVALLVWLPVALVGTVLNGLPYKLPGWIVAWLSTPVPDRATFKVFLSLFLFPAAWIAEAWLTGRLLGGGWALVMVLAAPISGYVALLYSERGRRLIREARAYRTLLSPSRAVAAARDLRGEILKRIEELVTLYRQGRATD